MDRELHKRLLALENQLNGQAASIIALQAVLSAVPEIGRVPKGQVAELLDLLTNDQPHLQLLRRRAGDVANELIDRAAGQTWPFPPANGRSEAGERDL